VENKAKSIIQHLKNSQKKITPQREKIIELLFNNNKKAYTTSSHPTAEEIYSKLQNIENGISISTVYNTLELLKEEKIIEEFATPLLNERGKGSAIRIETNIEPHFNLICSKCHKVEDLFVDGQLDILQKTILEKSQFFVDKYEFYGLCKTCKS
jgi:Fur family peroxide stress response transcriptional regulator